MQDIKDMEDVIVDHRSCGKIEKVRETASEWRRRVYVYIQPTANNQKSEKVLNSEEVS